MLTTMVHQWAVDALHQAFLVNLIAEMETNLFDLNNLAEDALSNYSHGDSDSSSSESTFSLGDSFSLSTCSSSRMSTLTTSGSTTFSSVSSHSLDGAFQMSQSEIFLEMLAELYIH